MLAAQLAAFVQHGLCLKIAVTQIDRMLQSAADAGQQIPAPEQFSHTGHILRPAVDWRIAAINAQQQRVVDQHGTVKRLGEFLLDLLQIFCAAGRLTGGIRETERHYIGIGLHLEVERVQVPIDLFPGRLVLVQQLDEVVFH